MHGMLRAGLALSAADCGAVASTVLCHNTRPNEPQRQHVSSKARRQRERYLVQQRKLPKRKAVVTRVPA